MTSISEPTQPFDHHDPELGTEPALVARQAQMRAQCPIVHTEAQGGMYVVTGYDAARAIASRPKTFSSAKGVMIPYEDREKIPPLEFDPPEHTRWRKFMNAGLSAKAVAAIEPAVKQRVESLIDAFAHRGSCDLVAEFAVQVPTMTIAELVGITADARSEMVQRAHAWMGSAGTPDQPAEDARFAGFVMGQVQARRDHPTGDYLTTAVTEPVDGRMLSDGEIVGLMIALLVGGHHSTTSTLASMLMHVGSDEQLRARLISDPQDIEAAIEETVRLDTPLQAFARQATETTTVEGVEIPAGADVFVCYGAANRDPSVFDQPDEFDLERTPNPHLGFGVGIHKCVGIHLARMQVRVAVAAILRRIPDYQLVDVPVAHVVGGMQLLLPNLAVTFTPAEAATN